MEVDYKYVYDVCMKCCLCITKCKHDGYANLWNCAR